MDALDRLGRALDRVLGVFAPVAAAKRSLARSAYYAAAKTTLSTGGWHPADPRVNEIIGNSAHAVRARARQLVRDMPQMATAIRRLKDFTVGTGIVYEPRVLDASSGKLDKKTNQKIADAWNFWAEEADDAGRLHLYDIQALCEGQEAEVGEYVLVKKQSRAAGRYLPFSLQVLEVDQLAEGGEIVLPGNQAHRGVEYDPRTGKVQAYHFQDAEKWRNTIRVPAADVLFGFETLRPGQLRGISPLAPAVTLAYGLRDYLETHMDGARAAARILSWIESPDPVATMADFGVVRDLSTSTDRRVEEIGTLVQQYLKTGEKVHLANPNRPGDSFEPFTRFSLQSFAVVVGVTYELVSGNYTDAKYTGARLARNDFLAGIKTRRGRRVRHLCAPLQRDFFRWAVVTGRLDLPGYFANPWPYLRGTWLGPGAEPIDPLRENRANIEAVQAGHMSPQEIIRGRGRDSDEVLDELQEWQEDVGERGIVLGAPSKNLQTNPAAVAPGTGSGDGKGKPGSMMPGNGDGNSEKGRLIALGGIQ